MLRISKRNLLGLTAAAASTPQILWAQDTYRNPRLMEGPMVGAVTPASAIIWGRSSAPVPISVEYDTAAHFPAPKRTAPVTPTDADDYTVHMTIADLAPATVYFYRIIVDGRIDRYQSSLPPFQFRTAPAPKWRGRFSIAYGSCARVQQDREQPVWKAVEMMTPDLFFWVGDNIYADTQDIEIFSEEYRRQRSVPALQPLIRNIPQLAVWDDHDFGVNDGDRNNPNKAGALAVFKQYWANPGYGLPEAPGVFFTYSYGGIDFFFLDDRYNRDPNADAPSAAKTMLGAAQKAWLKAGLKASQAPFKVLISGSGWVIGKGQGGDAWSSYTEERNELFDFIRDNNIGGVVLMSGDTHVAELNCVPWSEKGGYDFYDFVSSPLAQATETSWIARRPEIRIRQVFAGDCNFGLITFDTTKEPTLTFNVVDTLGRRAWAPFVITAAELKNGVTSWSNKIDETSRRNHERWKAGGPYYVP